MRISPSGFPFKVVVLDGTISEQSIYEGRVRICDRGALVSLYEKPDGTIGYRCGSEPVETFVRKGGSVEETVGRGCLCNGLLATAGLAFENKHEPPIVTLGDDYSFLKYLMTDANGSYTAADVMKYFLG